MRKKILVTYSVKYCKEVELEVNENINNILKVDTIITADNFPVSCAYLESQPEISDLPIPDTFTYDGKFGQELEKVEYIDGSFEVESFEQIEK
jgi:hypothetical protein